MSRHQSTGQNRSLKIGNKSLKNVATVTYLDKTLTNQNYSLEEVK